MAWHYVNTDGEIAEVNARPVQIAPQMEEVFNDAVKRRIPLEVYVIERQDHRSIHMLYFAVNMRRRDTF